MGFYKLDEVEDGCSSLISPLFTFWGIGFFDFSRQGKPVLAGTCLPKATSVGHTRPRV